MKFLLDFYYRVLQVSLMSLMGLMIVPVLLQILSRQTGVIPRYVWTEEAARFCFVWIIMIGSVIAVREGSHFSVDLPPHPRTRRWKAVSNLLVHGAMMLMALVFTWYGWGFSRFGFIQTSEMSGINMLSIYISFPLAGASWALFLLEKILEDVREFSKPEPGEPS